MYTVRAAAGLAMGLVLQQSLDGWWDLVAPVALLAAAMLGRSTSVPGVTIVPAARSHIGPSNVP